MECNSPECKSTIESATDLLEATLKQLATDLGNIMQITFKDEEGGLRWDIRKIKERMVTKTMVWAALVVMGLPLAYTGVNIWSFKEHADYRYGTREGAIEREARLKVIEGKYAELHKELSDIRLDMRSNTEMILGYIRRYSNEDPGRNMGPAGLGSGGGIPPTPRRDK